MEAFLDSKKFGGGEKMPNKKNIESVAELKEKISKAASVVLINYEGITVADDTLLRRKMRDAKVEYTVAKNRLFKIALQEAGVTDDFGADLEGTTSFVFSYDDAVAGAKVAYEFAAELRKSKKSFFVIKAGLLTGKRIDAKVVEELAKLPSKEVLISRLLGSLNEPIRGLAYVLNAIKDKK